MSSSFIRAGAYGVNTKNVVYYTWEEDLSSVCVYLNVVKDGRPVYLEYSQEEGSEGIIKSLHKLTLFASKYTDRKSAGNFVFIAGGHYAFSLAHVVYYSIEEPVVTLYFDVPIDDKPVYLEFGDDEDGPKIIQFFQQDAPNVM